MFLPYELLRRFFSRQISSNPIFIITFIFLKDYQPCTTHSCVCVCVCMWHSLNFNEAVSEINSGFADKLCIQKKWINQIVVKQTIDCKSNYHKPITYLRLYNKLISLVYDYFDFKLTVGSSLKLAVMWPFPRDQQNICQPLVFYRFTLLTCHWKTTQPYGQQLYKVNVTCRY